MKLFILFIALSFSSLTLAQTSNTAPTLYMSPFAAIKFHRLQQLAVTGRC